MHFSSTDIRSSAGSFTREVMVGLIAYLARRRAGGKPERFPWLTDGTPSRLRTTAWFGRHTSCAAAGTGTQRVTHCPALATKDHILVPVSSAASLTERAQIRVTARIHARLRGQAAPSCRVVGGGRR